MSLVMVVRPADGGIVVAVDTAISMEFMGSTFRVANFEDYEKVIEHDDALIFCSGDYGKCVKIRTYIRSLPHVDAEAISKYAQEIFNHDTRDNSTGILIVRKNGDVVGLLSAQGFKVTSLPWPDTGMGIHVLGFHMEDAYRAACDASRSTDYVAHMICKAYSTVLCEEVGGHLCLYSCREDTPWNKVVAEFEEPKTISKIIAENSSPAHCIVSAKDFLLTNGTSMVSALSSDGSKIKGEHLDLRGVNIVNENGDRVLYIDETGLHWDSKFSPFKSQYSTSVNGPWHDIMQGNDEYRRDSTDGGTTWGIGYKFVAKDGSPGDPKGYLSSIKITEINEGSVKSALIEAATIAGAKMYGGIFGDVPAKVNGVYQQPNVWIEMGRAAGGLGGYSMKLFHKEYSVPLMEVWDNSFGETALRMKNKTVFTQENYVTKPKGDWDFSGASVNGIQARFG